MGVGRYNCTMDVEIKIEGYIKTVKLPTWFDSLSRGKLSWLIKKFSLLKTLMEPLLHNVASKQESWPSMRHGLFNICEAISGC